MNRKQMREQQTSTIEQTSKGEKKRSDEVFVLIQDVPTDLNAIIEKYTNKESATDPNKKLISIPFDMGTSWWRADQFFKRGIQFANDASKAAAPENSKQNQDYELPYNKAVYEMMVTMGVLGHPVGDNSQPLHNTTDYDGWANNQGGLHSYYEEKVVTFFGPNLQSQIVDRAKKMKNRKFLDGANTIEKMKRLSVMSVADLKSVQKADPIIKNSQLKIERGMSLKTPAERQPPEKGLARFQKSIVDHMGRSALLLAHLWDEIYKQGGAPDLKPYKSYQYPYTVPFVMPDYYDVAVESKK